jgi:hypothetical protein
VQKHSSGKNKTERAMPRRNETNPTGSLEKLVSGLPTTKYMMNVTVIYDSAQTHKWAGEVYQKVEKVLGAKAVRGSWWNIADMLQPGVLAGAVSTAIHSDMIVIAVGGSEGLPLPFYFWVNAWLPHRLHATGALVALLGSPLQHNSESGRLRRYLRAVARRSRMDLLVSEHHEELVPRNALS